MKEYKKKWNKYEIGKVSWINDNRKHIVRKKFIDFIKKSDVKSIVEIGGGELVEAQSLISYNANLNYAIVDISKVFLDYARSIKGIEVYEGSMVDIPIYNKKFDFVYCTSVLEHSPDIHKTMEEMKRISDKFYFNMFTWKIKTGDLKSKYHRKKKYFSTVFNIDMLLDLIREHGDIEEMTVCNKEGGEISFDKYRVKNPDIDINRNTKYLLIRGVWRK